MVRSASDYERSKWIGVSAGRRFVNRECPVIPGDNCQIVQMRSWRKAYPGRLARHAVLAAGVATRETRSPSGIGRAPFLRPAPRVKHCGGRLSESQFTFAPQFFSVPRKSRRR